MKKILIGLLKKLTYRCEHDWVLENMIKQYHNEDSVNPYEIRNIYRCTKCMKIKKIKL